MIFVTFEFCGILILNYQFKLSSNGTPALHTLILSGVFGF